MKKKTWLTGMAGMVLMISTLGACGKEEGISEGAFTTIEKTSFTETIEVDGTVECSDPHFVYSTLTLPVEAVYVKEGDKVQPGDLLCVLDTNDMKDQIAMQQAVMAVTAKNANTGVSAARRQYDIYTEGLVNGTDANLVAARTKVEQAREAYEVAAKQYEDYKQSIDMGMDPTLIAADQAVARAATAIQQAKSMQDKLENQDYATDLQKEEAEDAVDSANLQYVQAKQSRENLLRQSDINLSNYAKNMENAQWTYIYAQANYDAAVRSLENARDISTDAITQAALAGDVSVEELQIAQIERKMADAQIFSECAGTVTAVNIEVGENATGVLFVIEDTKDLVMTARVPEKDINTITTNMKVSVTPKADNSDTYNGSIEKIADAAAKNASGKTDTSGEDAEYKVTIDIAAPNDKIRIGMNAEAEFIVYQKDDCFALPNKAIYTDEEGKSYILMQNGSSTDDKGVEHVTIQKAEITVVYEGESMSVVEGNAISEGCKIFTDAASNLDKAGTNIAIEK